MAATEEHIEFRHDSETGILMAYKGNECVGPIISTGDIPALDFREEMREIIRGIYENVARLEAYYPDRRFTPDGHMIGSLGEVAASGMYGLVLFKPSYPIHDGMTCDGRFVQIKTTQGNRIAISEKPDFLIVLRMGRDGTFEEIYNGPGEIVWNAAGRVMKNGQRPISLARLRKLNEEVDPEGRIPSIE